MSKNLYLVNNWKINLASDAINDFIKSLFQPWKNVSRFRM